MKRVSVGKTEHVHAQSNVWEIKREKQMAALKMKGRGKGGGKRDDEPKYNINDLCCVYAHPFHFTISSILPERQKMGGGGDEIAGCVVTCF